jgi:hypothetical protein
MSPFDSLSTPNIPQRARVRPQQQAEGKALTQVEAARSGGHSCIKPQSRREACSAILGWDDRIIECIYFIVVGVVGLK